MASKEKNNDSIGRLVSIGVNPVRLHLTALFRGLTVTAF